MTKRLALKKYSKRLHVKWKKICKAPNRVNAKNEKKKSEISVVIICIKKNNLIVFE